MPFPPQSFGGIDQHLISLAKSLKLRGHDINIVSGLDGGDFLSRKFSVMNRVFKKPYREKYDGVYISRDWNLERAITKHHNAKPVDLVFLNAGPGLYKYIPTRLGIPAVSQFHGVRPLADVMAHYERGVRHFCGVSQFITNGIRERLTDRDAEILVLHNIFDKEQYSTGRTGDEILFINPIKIKGAELVLDLAETNPSLKFRVVRSWRIGSDIDARILERFSKLKNVSLHEPTKQIKMHYKEARVLLVPSTIEEGMARVITEAQSSGVPVIASSKGGCPEATGKGGFVLPPDDINQWQEALSKLMLDEGCWKHYSQAAIESASRQEFTEIYLVEKYEELFHRAIRSKMQ